MKMFNIELFFKKSKEITLTKDEKSKILMRLHSYITASPSDVDILQRASWGQFIFQSFSFILRPIPLTLVIVCGLGIGTAWAAESTLPGDTLYPVKTSITEPIRGWFAFSSSSQANWNVTLTARRLEEAEYLAATAQIDEPLRIKLEKQIADHVQQAELQLAEVEEQDRSRAFEISSRLATSLETHINILDQIGVSLNGETQNQVEQLRGLIEDRKGSIEDGRELARSAVRGDDKNLKSAESKMKTTEKNIKEIKNIIKKTSPKMNEAIYLAVQSRLATVDDIFKKGNTSLNAGAYGEAFIEFQKAQDGIQELYLLVNAYLKYSEDDEKPVSIPSIAPRISSTPQPEITSKKNHDKNDNDRSEDKDKQKESSRSKSRIRIEFD